MKFQKVLKSIILGVLVFNIFILAIPINSENFEKSDHFIIPLLKSLGFEPKESGNFHQVPSLTSDLPSSTPQGQYFSDNINLRLSDYYVQGWADTRWQYRKNITIDSSKVSSDLTNFPVLIDIFDSGLQQDAQASGNDLLFTDASGNLLDHELELYDRIYNSTHAHLTAWVKTNVSSTQNTVISLYYGNPSIPNQENPTGVWDNNYQAVYHLNDDPTGTVNDSTLNNNDGTTSGSMTSSDQVQGIFDGSLDFDGSDDLINIGDVNSNSWTGITAQAWIFHDVTGDDRIICKSAGTATQDHIISLAVVTSGSDDVLRVRFATDGVGGSLASQSSDSFATFTTGTWHHIAFTWDSTSETIYLYIDGSQDIYSYPKDGDSIKDSAVPVILANVNLGSDNRFFDGKIDEARISNVARSADWINTEYKLGKHMIIVIGIYLPIDIEKISLLMQTKYFKI
jgi:hypothetical protein